MSAHLFRELLQTHRELRHRCMKSAREHADFAPLFVQRARDNNRIIVRAKRQLRGFAP